MSRTINAAGTHKAAPKGGSQSKEDALAKEDISVLGFSVRTFRGRLSRWYGEHARELPWRGVGDPYATWLSEIMLQQTRVATVIGRYKEFLRRFPTIGDLAKANEADVLTLWSGLGYYGRARMLLRGAQFVEREMQGGLPQTAAELRKLPGVGEYTAAAIASIAFGESVAVLDGNVERVLLRVLGEPEEKSARARARLVEIAQMLTPPAKRGRATKSDRAGDRGGVPEDDRTGDYGNPLGDHGNAPGDHNQAMMELGATICLPRGPLCLQCPVVELCKTRGEHPTGARRKMQSRTVSHLLALRKRGVATEVLLERRAKEMSLMAGMMELPGLPLEATEGREPALRLRHSITDTNYYVQIFTESEIEEPAVGHLPEHLLLEQIPAAKADLEWVPTTKLAQQPLTGLARKVLQRLQVMTLPQLLNRDAER